MIYASWIFGVREKVVENDVLGMYTKFGTSISIT